MLYVFALCISVASFFPLSLFAGTMISLISKYTGYGITGGLPLNVIILVRDFLWLYSLLGTIKSALDMLTTDDDKRKKICRIIFSLLIRT